MKVTRGAFDGVDLLTQRPPPVLTIAVGYDAQLVSLAVYDVLVARQKTRWQAEYIYCAKGLDAPVRDVLDSKFRMANRKPPGQEILSH